MKILHTADWHIGQFKGPVVDGVNLRSQDIPPLHPRCKCAVKYVRVKNENIQ